MSENWSPWTTVKPQSRFDRAVEVPGGIRWVPPDMLVLPRGRQTQDRPIVSYLNGVVLYHNLRPVNLTSRSVTVGGVRYDPIGTVTDDGPKRLDRPKPGEAVTAPALVSDKQQVKRLRDMGWWWPIVIPTGLIGPNTYRRFLWFV